MQISSEDIIEWASRYIAVEGCRFPENNDLFIFLSRQVPENKVLKDGENWQFSGYGICAGYQADETAKPQGKWIYMDYYDLTTYPPQLRSLRLQPPHVALGKFFSQDRSLEIKMVKWERPEIPALELGEEEEPKTDNIVAFRRR